MNIHIRMAVVAVLAVTATVALPSIASQVTGLVSFTSGTPAKASEVNGNFTAVKTAVDDNQAQIAALRAELTDLKSKLTNVTALNTYLSLQTVNGQPTMRVTAANLQVVNGEGNTESKNGTGNLIVGYDESRADSVLPQCAQATTDLVNMDHVGLLYKFTVFDQAKCADAGAVFAVNHKSGSHNIIVGPYHNYSAFGGAVFGSQNTIAYNYASVVAGSENISAGTASSVTGGFRNQAYTLATVSGGEGNVADAESSIVSGGAANHASGPHAVVSGGLFNLAYGRESVVSGGNSRTVSGDYDWRGGSLSSDF